MIMTCITPAGIDGPQHISCHFPLQLHSDLHLLPGVHILCICDLVGHLDVRIAVTEASHVLELSLAQLEQFPPLVILQVAQIRCGSGFLELLPPYSTSYIQLLLRRTQGLVAGLSTCVSPRRARD